MKKVISSICKLCEQQRILVRILEDEFGTTIDTCTTSSIGVSIEEVGGGSGSHPGGKLWDLGFSNCTHKTTVDARGAMRFQFTTGRNGSVISSGAEITVQSTFFGATCLMKTGTGTTIGTLTGAPSSSGHATLHVTATLNGGICGNSRWTGTYFVTSPTGLYVASS